MIIRVGFLIEDLSHVVCLSSIKSRPCPIFLGSERIQKVLQEQFIILLP